MEGFAGTMAYRDSEEGGRLEHSPLVRVLCQAVWPLLSKPNTAVVAERVADAIGDAYPLRETQHEMQVTVTPQGIAQEQGGTVYRFVSADQSWAVSLHDSFVALETSAYTDHTDFVDRFGEVFEAVKSASPAIPFLVRLGYRYLNRITDETDLARLADYFEPGVLGGLAPGAPAGLVHSITESVYRDGEHYLLVRSAMLGEGVTIDPTMPPVDSKSWILDLDAYDEAGTEGLSLSGVRERTLELAGRAGGHFHQVIKPGFEERFR